MTEARVMADDLSNLSTFAISPAGEALREFKHLPDKRRRERAKGTPIALESLAEEEPIEDQAAGEKHQLDVSA
jgi:hypothetical protein